MNPISSKLKNHQAGVYITATPIGNLGDITLRALDVLATAQLILAEDTRRTRKLLTHFDIHPKKLASFHDHSAISPALIHNIQAIIEKNGLVALVSDAGTPLISDPGFNLIRVLVQHNLPIVPLPGASSVCAAISIAALPCHRWSFGGFIPSKQGARLKFLHSFNYQEPNQQGGALIFFETALRLHKTLQDMISIFGPLCPAVFAREMTKKFETIQRGSLAELATRVQNQQPKGEITIIIAPLKTKGQSK